MSDAAKELGELKREVVETRNQAIKTDNQMKNLSLDIKSFEGRFVALEKRTRLAGAATNLILATVILGAAYTVHRIRTHSLTAASEQAQVEATAMMATAEKVKSEAEARIKGLETGIKQRAESEKAVGQIFDHLDAKRDAEALELLIKLDAGALGQLAERLSAKRLGDFRKRMAAEIYRSARSQLNTGAIASGLEGLHRSLTLEPSGRYATPARYLLATTLWAQKRYGETIPVLEEMRKRGSDKALEDEVRFLLAASLARDGKRERAGKLFGEVIAANGRYVGAAKGYQAAIAEGGELPALPGSKIARAGTTRSVATQPTEPTVAATP